MAEATAPQNLLKRIWLRLHPDMNPEKVGIHEVHPEHPGGSLFVARADQPPQEAALTAAVREALSQNRVIETDAPAEPTRPALANLPSQPEGPLDSMPPVTATPDSMAPKSPSDLSPRQPPVMSSEDQTANPPSDLAGAQGAGKNSPTVAAEQGVEPNEPKTSK